MARVIAVQGGRGGVGKTTLAISLAVSLAAHNKKVLLLEMDLPNPMLHELIPRKTVGGRYVNEYILGEAGLDEVVEDVSEWAYLQDGSLLVGYANPSIGARNRADVLNAEKDRRITKVMRNETWRIRRTHPLDYVIIDSPTWSDFIMANITAVANNVLYLLRPSSLEVNILKRRLREFYSLFKKNITSIINLCPKDDAKVRRLVQEIKSIGIKETYCLYYEPALSFGVTRDFIKILPKHHFTETINKIIVSTHPEAFDGISDYQVIKKDGYQN